MNKKYCPYCHCSKVIRFSKRNGRQRYRCKVCHKTWINKRRQTNLPAKIWRDFSYGNMLVEDLAKKYSKHPNTILKILHGYKLPPIEQRPRQVVIIMDVTYFGRGHGELVVVDANAKLKDNFLLYHETLHGIERTIDYEVAVDTIEAMGYTILAAVIDGRRGVHEMLKRHCIPAQLCQFHQLQTITQCLTRHPDLAQNRQLHTLALTLSRTNLECFELALAGWILKYNVWLVERNHLPNGHWEYRHPKTRRAYFSLKHHLPYLFTYERYPVLRIPNTTSKLEGVFGHIKPKMKIHRGYSVELKTKLFYSLFPGATEGDNNRFL